MYEKRRQMLTRVGTTLLEPGVISMSSDATFWHHVEGTVGDAPPRVRVHGRRCDQGRYERAGAAQDRRGGLEHMVACRVGAPTAPAVAKSTRWAALTQLPILLESPSTSPPGLHAHIRDMD